LPVSDVASGMVLTAEGITPKAELTVLVLMLVTAHTSTNTSMAAHTSTNTCTLYVFGFNGSTHMDRRVDELRMRHVRLVVCKSYTLRTTN
jgi:hypothetical protein